MSDVPWEALPSDTRLTCSVAHDPDSPLPWWWSINALDPHRCGKPAAFVNRETCGCGKVDMTLVHCVEHHEIYTRNGGHFPLEQRSGTPSRQLPHEQEGGSE